MNSTPQAPSATKIKRFIDLHVPVTTCNLHCHYCYIYQHRLFRNKLPEFKYSPDVVAKALSVERLGGVCLINFCGGGETLLPPEIPTYIRRLLEEGHYVSVVTNGTLTKRFEEIAQFPEELRSRLFFKFSYHYIQLKQKGWFDRFFNNIRMMRDAGCSFTLELTPNDETIPYIQEFQELAVKELGAPAHITVARNEVSEDRLKPILTKLSREEYAKTWGTPYESGGKVYERSGLFDFKFSIFGEKRREFCYAGLWSFYLDLGTGMKSQCYCTRTWQNIFDDPEKPIDFSPIGYKCKEPHCFNGHAFLAFGDIPELETPTYASLRNRVCADGSEWLTPAVKAFYSGKLKDSNRPYSAWEKAMWWLRYTSMRGKSILKHKLHRH